MLVKWKGYGDADNTEEPLENMIRDVPDLAEDFILKNFGCKMDTLQRRNRKGMVYFAVQDKNLQAQMVKINNMRDK